MTDDACSREIEARKKIEYALSILEQIEPDSLLSINGQDPRTVAARCFLEAAELLPEEPYPLFRLGLLYHHPPQNLRYWEPNFERAEDAYLRALDIAPENAPTLFALSALYATVEDEDLMHEYLRKTEEVYQSLWMVIREVNEASLVLDQQRFYYVSLSELHALVEDLTPLCPIAKKADLWFSLGLMYGEASHLDQAIGMYEKVWKLEQVDDATRKAQFFAAANAATDFADPEKALMWAKRAESIMSDSADEREMFTFMLGWLAEEMVLDKGEPSGFLDLVRSRDSTLRFLPPSKLVGEYDLGLIYLAAGILAARRGELQEALDYLSFSIQVSPRDPRAYIELGDVLSELGRPVKAEEAYSQAEHLTSTGAAYRVSVDQARIRRGLTLAKWMRTAAMDVNDIVEFAKSSELVDDQNRECIEEGAQLYHDEKYLQSLRVLYPSIEAVMNKMLIKAGECPESKRFRGIVDKAEWLSEQGYVAPHLLKATKDFVAKVRNQALHGDLSLSDEYVSLLCLMAFRYLRELLTAYRSHSSSEQGNTE